MHLLIPFAAPLSEAGRTSLQGLVLPVLEALLAELSPTLRHEGDEYQLSPPHERALGAALGWQGADGALPWAAQSAIADGLDVRSRARLAVYASRAKRPSSGPAVNCFWRSTVASAW